MTINSIKRRRILNRKFADEKAAYNEVQLYIFYLAFKRKYKFIYFRSNFVILLILVVCIYNILVIRSFEKQ